VLKIELKGIKRIVKILLVRILDTWFAGVSSNSKRISVCRITVPLCYLQGAARILM